MYAGCSNGDILFQFGGARAANHPSSTSLGTLSVGQQWQVTSKLRKLIAGQEADLSFQLWDDWSADVSSSNSDNSGSFTDSSSAESGTHSSLHANGSDATPSFPNGHDRHHSDARQTEDRMIRAIAQGVLSTQETADGNQELAALSGNGYSAASSRQWYTPPPSFQPDGPEHQQGTSSQDAVYSSMESDEASPRQDTHYSASTSASSLASEQPATSVDRNLSRRARRRLREHYTEGADTHTSGLEKSAGQSEPTAPPVTYPWPRALSKKESQVPCYKWHEAGPPTRTLLSAPHSKAPPTADDEADSDTEDATASEALTAEHDVFPTRRQLQELSEKAAQSSVLVFLRPVLRLAVGLWRLLPYWVRHLLRSGRGRRPPALHASPMLSEHIRSGRRDAVPGSSFNPASGQHTLRLLHHNASTLRNMFSAVLFGPCSVCLQHLCMTVHKQQSRRSHWI